MAEKLKFRCVPGRLLVQETDAGDIVIAAGAGCKAAIGDRVRRKPSARPKLLVTVDNERYRIDHDEDVETVRNEE